MLNDTTDIEEDGGDTKLIANYILYIYITTLIELASQIKPMSDLQQPLFVKIKQDLTDMNRYRENYREAWKNIG